MGNKLQGIFKKQFNFREQILQKKRFYIFYRKETVKNKKRSVFRRRPPVITGGFTRRLRGGFGLRFIVDSSGRVPTRRLQIESGRLRRRFGRLGRRARSDARQALPLLIPFSTVLSFGSKTKE